MWFLTALLIYAYVIKLYNNSILDIIINPYGIFKYNNCPDISENSKGLYKAFNVAVFVGPKQGISVLIKFGF